MWVVSPLIWLSFAGYGYWIATIKRRNPGEGIALGLLLGPLGCVVEAGLKERAAEPIEQERLRRREETQARREAQEKWRSAVRAEALRLHQEASARAEEARARRAEALRRFAEWFDRTVLQFGWYKTLPEVAQPIVVGLLIALPPVTVLVLVFRGR